MSPTPEPPSPTEGLCALFRKFCVFRYIFFACNFKRKVLQQLDQQAKRELNSEDLILQRRCRTRRIHVKI